MEVLGAGGRKLGGEVGGGGSEGKGSGKRGHD